MTPDKFTNQTFMLDVGDDHKLHVVDWGNPNSKTPFIFLHGGPGGNVEDRHKRPFNPKTHRVIFFDQRGCGQSTPYGSLKNNTTDALAEDITKITDHLKIKNFHLYGYSWGSCLALYYAIKNPAKVQTLVIGGVYSGANDYPEIFDRLGTFFPDTYAQVLADIPEEHHQNLADHLQTTISTGAPTESQRALRLLRTAEATIASYDSDLHAPEPQDDFDPIPVQIGTHYIFNNCFLPEPNYLLNHATEIKCPTYIVQGRSDLVCPPKFAYQISQKLPHAQLFWANSNHHKERELNSILRTICAML